MDIKAESKVTKTAGNAPTLTITIKADTTQLTAELKAIEDKMRAIIELAKEMPQISV